MINPDSIQLSSRSDIKITDKKAPQNTSKLLTINCQDKFQKEISFVSMSLSRTLFFSNNNINSICKSYDKLLDETKPHSIHKIDIYNQLLSGNVFIDMFFDDNSIYFDNYFQFVCLFSFFNIDQITSMLLTLSKVRSSVFMTKAEVMKFISDYSLSPSFYNDLLLFDFYSASDKPSPTNERYSVSNFIYLCENNLQYINAIHSLRQSMKQSIFSKSEYKAIVNRMLCKYYPTFTKYTHESCFDRLKRKLFTNDPCPDEYDYGLSDPTPECFKHVISLLERQFDNSNITQSHSSATYGRIDIESRSH